MEKEIRTELDVCRANPEAAAFYDHCWKEGKRMIIVSDMYLSHSDIEDILTGSGYDIKGIPVYVSSEYGLTKRTGSLFKAVLRKEGMEGREKEVLHIGDNLI